MAFSFQPVENPLVEVEAPVQEGVRSGGVGFAESVGKGVSGVLALVGRWGGA